MSRRPESVLVVIYTPAEILLLKRNSDFEFWQSVTGSLEVGEMPADAASRELLEETGISGIDLVDCQHHVYFDIAPQWQKRFPPGVTRNKEHVFLCPLTERSGVTLCAEEHTDYLWLGHAEALAKATSVTNRAAIERFVIGADGSDGNTAL